MSSRKTEQGFAEAEARLQTRRIVRNHALMGAFIGTALALASWVFELLRRDLGWNLVNIATIHDHNPLLYLIDFAPLIAAALFGKIGQIQARITVSNLELEDRVNERTFQITLEKARTSAIFDNAADGIITFNERGIIESYNRAAQRIFGYESGDAIGRSLRMMLPALEWDPQSDSFSRLIQTRGVESGAGNSREIEGLRRDGTSVPIDIDISKFSVGEDLFYTAIVRDITERKRNERLQKSLTRVTEMVNKVQDLGQLYRAIRDSLGEVIDVSNLSIALYDPKSESFEIAYSMDERAGAGSAQTSGEHSLFALVLDKGVTLSLTQAQLDRLVREGRVHSADARFTSWLGVPLLGPDRAVGVLAVKSYEEGVFFSERDVWVMNFISSQIANAIDREHARELLRQNERRYRRIVEEAGELVFTTDLLGKFTYTNPTVSRVTGYSDADLLLMNFFDLVEEMARKSVSNFYHNQRESQIRESLLEFVLVTRDNRRRWIEQKTTLLYDEGEVIGYEAVAHDVTDRREAEEALREREERFRSLSSSSPIGVFQLDAHGSCIYVNTRFEEITGRPSNEVMGGSWMNVIHREERETFRTEWIFAREEGAAAAREVRVETPDGQVRWVNVRWAATHDSKGVTTGYVGTFEDITRRKRSERISQVLYDISQSAQESMDLLEFFARLQKSLDTVIDTTNFYVALYDPELQVVRFPYAMENRVESLNLPPRPVGKGLTGYMLRKGKPVLLDERGMRAVYEAGEAELIGKPAKNWLGIPLMNDGRPIGAVIIQSYTDTSHFSEADLQTMTVVSTQITAAILRKQGEEAAREYTRQLAEAHKRIKEDLATAARVQRARLPKEAPDFPGLEFTWLFDSCEEVAGDMFNFVPLDQHRLGVYILDVSGHGVSAALLSMSLSRALTAANDGSGVLLRREGLDLVVASPAAVMEAMNERFPMNLETNQYFTMLYGILDMRDFRFRWVRAGHPAPVMVTQDGARELGGSCGPAVGIIPGIRYQENELVMAPGESLVLFTDGVDESASGSGEEFGLQRVISSLGRRQGEPIETAVRALRSDIDEFTGGRAQTDDITIVGFRILQDAVEQRMKDSTGTAGA